MPMGESVMPVVEVGAVPRHAELVEPGGAEFDFKTFAEIAFGLRWMRRVVFIYLLDRLV
jgi:hypothetical protein